MELTEQQRAFRDHLLAGTDVCMVCGNELRGRWTDYNGEIKCGHCGTPHQIYGSHLNDQTLNDLGITAGQVARKYTDHFDVIPILKLYWEETGKPNPFGMFFGNGWVPREWWDDFHTWLLMNVDRLEPLAPDGFNWTRIRADRESALKENANAE